MKNEYLAHYGVKGMKWGKHKARAIDDLAAESGVDRNATQAQNNMRIAQQQRQFTRESMAARRKTGAKNSTTQFVRIRVGGAVADAKVSKLASKKSSGMKRVTSILAKRSKSAKNTDNLMRIKDHATHTWGKK